MTDKSRTDRQRLVETLTAQFLENEGLETALRLGVPSALRADANRRMVSLLRRAAVSSPEQVLAVTNTIGPTFNPAAHMPWDHQKASVDTIVTSQRLILGAGQRFATYPLNAAVVRHDVSDFERGGYVERLVLLTEDDELSWGVGMEPTPEYEPGPVDALTERLRLTLALARAGVEQARYEGVVLGVPQDVPHWLDTVRAMILAGTRAAQTGVPENVSFTATTLPVLRLIRSPRDAEKVAAEWLDHWGLGPCSLTGKGADGGVDVTSRRVVAQVKMEALPVARPVVQQIYGVAAYEGREAVCFALAGFTTEALDWANRAKVALFRFDLQGAPQPENRAGEVLMQPSAGAES